MHNKETPVRPEIEWLERNQGPLGTGRQMRIGQRERGFNPFRTKPEELLELVEVVYIGQEPHVQTAYEGLLDCIGLTRPTKYVPTAFFSCKRDGHVNRLDVLRPKFGYTDPKFVPWILAEENVKEMPCKNCRKILPLIMRLDLDIHTFKVGGSVDSYCNNPNCFAVVHFLKGPFRHGRIYRGIFK